MNKKMFVKVNKHQLWSQDGAMNNIQKVRIILQSLFLGVGVGVGGWGFGGGGQI